MLTVGNDAAGVERMLEEGSLGCPGCGGRLARWGHARKRTVFGPGREGRQVRPRRSRCTVCRVTHVLLPARLLLRRMDEGPVIGSALASAARGRGCRRVAAELGVPVDTVRGWLRRAAGPGGAGPGSVHGGGGGRERGSGAAGAGRVAAGRCAGGGRGGGRCSGGAVAAAARGVAVGDRRGGHERDLAGAGDGGPGIQREFPLVRGRHWLSPSMRPRLAGTATAEEDR